MLIQLFALISLQLLCHSQVGSDPHIFYGLGVRTGVIFPFNNLTSPSDGQMSFDVTYGTQFDWGSKRQVIAALSNFECLSANEFSFNSSCHDQTNLGFEFRLKLFGNTYFNLVKFNYVAFSYFPNPKMTRNNFFYFDCFLCTGLVIGSGQRSMTFKKQDIKSPPNQTNPFKVASMFSGMKFSNNRDSSKKISVNSYMEDSQPFIFHKISVAGNSSVEWVCLSTVLIDLKAQNIYTQFLMLQLGTIVLNTETSDIDTSKINEWQHKFYVGTDNSRMYGLSSIQLVQGEPLQSIKFDSEAPSCIQCTYEATKAGGLMTYFLNIMVQCNDLSKSILSIPEKMCYQNCPDGQYQYQSKVCFKCHYSCLTCSGQKQSQCQTCDALQFRQKDSSSGNSCPCQEGYGDIEISKCAPCTQIIEHCQECTSVSQCKTCKHGMEFNLTSQKCQCPLHEFFIENITTCVDYAGCVQATRYSNIIRCTKCNTSANFKLTGFPQRCQCNQHFELSTDGSGICQEICGDGVSGYQNSTQRCDDGNFDQGDGCSPTCTVQENYGCFNLPFQRSYCAQKESYFSSFLYAERIPHTNSAFFVFRITPGLSQSALNSSVNGEQFKVYIDSTSIPFTDYYSTIEIKSESYSIVKLKIDYSETIEKNQQTLNFTLDPYKISAAQKSFNLTSIGVNYELTYDSSVLWTNYIEYISMACGALVVLAAFMFSFSGNKIQSVELLLSAQFIWLGTLTLGTSSFQSSLRGLKYLAGFNQIEPYEIDLTNYKTSPLSSAAIHAQFCLNLNYMLLVYALVIFVTLPLKLLVFWKEYRRQSHIEAAGKSLEERYEKLMRSSQNIQSSPITLQELSLNIKWAERIFMRYIDKVYFIFSLVLMLPILVFFSAQLGFMRLSGTYKMGVLINILSSIMFLMVDFCFIVLIFQDTDKTQKIFKFARKKSPYPYRLILLYFTLCCVYCTFLVYSEALYIFTLLSVLPLIYVIIDNPYTKWSLQYVDSIMKPAMTILALTLLSAMKLFQASSAFASISILIVILFSTAFSFTRIIKKQFCGKPSNQVKTESKAENDNQNFQPGQQRYLFDETQQQDSSGKNKNSKKNKKSEATQILSQSKKGSSKKSNGKSKASEKKSQVPVIMENQIDQSRRPMMIQNEDEEEKQQQDQLERVKRKLRTDLKKRRGMVQKIAFEVSSNMMKKPMIDDDE